MRPDWDFFSLFFPVQPLTGIAGEIKVLLLWVYKEQHKCQKWHKSVHVVILFLYSLLLKFETFCV